MPRDLAEEKRRCAAFRTADLGHHCMSFFTTDAGASRFRAAALEVTCLPVKRQREGQIPILLHYLEDSPQANALSDSVAPPSRTCTCGMRWTNGMFLELNLEGWALGLNQAGQGLWRRRERHTYRQVSRENTIGESHEKQTSVSASSLLTVEKRGPWTAWIWISSPKAPSLDLSRVLCHSTAS
jgi:hypothetical protein